MAELAFRRILVVEDEYILAAELAQFLERHGATIVGPFNSVSSAMEALAREAVDGAVLDVNLGGERVYPVADALIARSVPIVFATGYDELLMHRPYLGLPRCQKPIDKQALLKALREALEARSRRS